MSVTWQQRCGIHCRNIREMVNYCIFYSQGPVTEERSVHVLKRFSFISLFVFLVGVVFVFVEFVTILYLFSQDEMNRYEEFKRD